MFFYSVVKKISFVYSVIHFKKDYKRKDTHLSNALLCIAVGFDNQHFKQFIGQELLEVFYWLAVRTQVSKKSRRARLSSERDVPRLPPIAEPLLTRRLI